MMNDEKIKKKNKDQNQNTGEFDLTKNQVILYIIIIAGAITIFILSMIGINPFMLLIIIGAVLIYMYFDKDIQNSDSTTTHNEIETE